MRSCVNLIRLALVGLALFASSAFAAQCVTFETAYVGTNTIVRKPGGVVTQGLVAWDMGAATTDSSGQFVCSAGAWVLLTPAEIKANSELRVKDSFGTATPEQYQAIASIFGLVLCAAATIWAARRLLRLFSHPAES